jgi:hypothetical protein
MTHSTDIQTLARLLAADFSNQEQAFTNPPFFAHIRVCMRPLPPSFLGEVSFFLEQAYDFMLNSPYRLRVFSLHLVNDSIKLKNYKLKDEESFYGAARDRQRLQQLTPENLEEMCGCDMNVVWTGTGFQGTIEPGKNCIVVRKGKTTYLDNSFEIDEDKLISFDRGFDTETDELAWGSVAGPFHFVRWASFADEVEL